MMSSPPRSPKATTRKKAVMTTGTAAAAEELTPTKVKVSTHTNNNNNDNVHDDNKKKETTTLFRKTIRRLSPKRNAPTENSKIRQRRTKDPLGGSDHQRRGRGRGRGVAPVPTSSLSPKPRRKSPKRSNSVGPKSRNNSNDKVQKLKYDNSDYDDDDDVIELFSVVSFCEQVEVIFAEEEVAAAGTKLKSKKNNNDSLSKYWYQATDYQKFKLEYSRISKLATQQLKNNDKVNEDDENTNNNENQQDENKNTDASQNDSNAVNVTTNAEDSSTILKDPETNEIFDTHGVRNGKQSKENKQNVKAAWRAVSRAQFIQRNAVDSSGNVVAENYSIISAPCQERALLKGLETAKHVKPYLDDQALTWPSITSTVSPLAPPSISTPPTSTTSPKGRNKKLSKNIAKFFAPSLKGSSTPPTSSPSRQ